MLFAVCIAREHRAHARELIRALHAADNPFDMDGGPRHPGIVDHLSYDYGAKARADGGSRPSAGGGSAPGWPRGAAPAAASWPQHSHEAGAKAACLW